MAHANKVEGILIGLDEVLDTRLGTIGLLSGEAAKQCLSSKQYFERETDEFDGVNMIEYKIRYAERDLAVLKNSVMTSAIFHLRDLLRQLKKQAVTTPNHDGVQVTVNLYPYPLSEEEKEELRRVLLERLNGGASLRVSGKDLVSIEFIYKKPEELTPAHCKASYGAMYMYNPWTWLNHFYKPETFETEVRLPEVIIYAPRLFHDGKPDADALRQYQAEFVGKAPDPLTFDEFRVSPIAGVTHLDVGYFSSSVRLQRNQATT